MKVYETIILTTEKMDSATKQKILAAALTRDKDKPSFTSIYAINVPIEMKDLTWESHQERYNGPKEDSIPGESAPEPNEASARAKYLNSILGQDNALSWATLTPRERNYWREQS